MPLPTLFRRNAKENAVTETTTSAAPLMQFLTVGGAVVELRAHRFSTLFTTYRGRGYLAHDREKGEVDGFVWSCRGCGGSGRDVLSDGQYLPGERGKARDDANEHAETCRAMPRPTA